MTDAPTPSDVLGGRLVALLGWIARAVCRPSLRFGSSTTHSGAPSTQTRCCGPTWAAYARAAALRIETEYERGVGDGIRFESARAEKAEAERDEHLENVRLAVGRLADTRADLTRARDDLAMEQRDHQGTTAELIKACEKNAGYTAENDAFRDALRNAQNLVDADALAAIRHAVGVARDSWTKDRDESEYDLLDGMGQEASIVTLFDVGQMADALGILYDDPLLSGSPPTVTSPQPDDDGLLHGNVATPESRGRFISARPWRQPTATSSCRRCGGSGCDHAVDDEHRMYGCGKCPACHGSGQQPTATSEGE